MSSRWHRSRLFWLGLAGLVMLAAAGVSFRDKVSVAGWASARCSFGISASPDSIIFGYVNHRHPALAGSTSWKTGFHTYSVVASTPTLWVPAMRMDQEGATIRIHLALWFILFSYSAVWFGGMVWWLRRKHRLIPESGLVENPSRPR